MKKYLRRSISLFLAICLLCTSLVGCEINSKHLKMKYENNDNEDIQEWGNVADGWSGENITTWDLFEEDEYANAVYSQLLFENILDEAPIIDCVIMDYQSDGKYFDGEMVYSMVNDQFDVNAFVSKYAIGTGVIVVCVILKVTTAGMPIACFISGAANSAIQMSIKGAAFGAAIKAVSSAIKTNGNIEEALYGALEGSSDGYMWGAIWGAAIGGFNSRYCFTENTLLQTEYGLNLISSVHVGDKVLAYDPNSDIYDFKTVSQVNKSQTQETVIVTIGEESFESTFTHPYLTEQGWKQVSDLIVGDTVKNKDGTFSTISNIEQRAYQEPIDIYTLCVEDYHSFLIGDSGIVVHNSCKTSDSGRINFDDDPELKAKCPSGVLKEDGFVLDWGEACKYKLRFDVGELTGNRTKDRSLVKKKLIAENPDFAGMTQDQAEKQIFDLWGKIALDHDRDCCTINFVDFDVHSSVSHRGGVFNIVQK